MVDKQSPPADFMKWKRALKAAEFSARGTGGRKGAYMVREAGPRNQGVGIMEDPHQPGMFNVQLNILINYKFADPPYDVVLLLGDLGRQDIVTEHTHYATWWQKDESEIAWEQMQSQGMAWLEKYSAAQSLIEFFETALRDGLPPAPAPDTPERPKRSWLKRAVAEIVTPPEPDSPPVPIGYHEWLALLYDEVGRRDDACRHAIIYRDHFKRGASAETRSQIQRLLGALGCGPGD